MARRRNRIGTAAVAVVASGLVAIASWLLLRDERTAPRAEDSTRARDPGDGPAVAQPGEARNSPTGPAQGASPGDDSATDEHHGDREALASGMAKLVRDLEFSPGQKEPPQQVVKPQPEPWRRDPSREGPAPEVVAVVPARSGAAGGGRASIRGRNLRVVQVMFGTNPAQLVAASGTEVVVEIPPGSTGPATVAVTNDDGTWTEAPEPFVYGD